MEIQIKIGVLIQKNNRLLLIKERHNLNEAHHWNIIKGTFDPEIDSDILKTAQRESKEEAGAYIRINHLLNIFFLKRKDKLTVQLNFIASLTKGNPKIADKKNQKQRAEDIIESRFFTKKELERMKREEFINSRAYFAIKDWISGKKHDLDLLRILFE